MRICDETNIYRDKVLPGVRTPPRKILKYATAYIHKLYTTAGLVVEFSKCA